MTLVTSQETRRVFVERAASRPLVWLRLETVSPKLMIDIELTPGQCGMIARALEGAWTDTPEGA